MYKDVDAFNAELQAAGAWVFAGGLHPADTATVVQVEDGEVVTTDGPFAETKEQLGGFWVIEAADLDAALALGGQGRRRPAGAPSRCARSRTSPRPERRRAGPTRSADRRSVFREESGRAVATLVRLFGDIDVAEEAVQEAFVVAVERWPAAGLPPNPGGWIITTARNRAIDRLRRESSRDDRHAQAAPRLHASDEPPEVGPVPDDRLRLIFTCCHPALAPSAQVALTLRLLGGLRPPRSPAPSSCPRPRWPSAWCGPSARSRPPSIPYRVPERRRAARPAAARCWPCLPGLQRGLRRHRPATTWCAPTCAPRPSAWPGCSPS